MNFHLTKSEGVSLAGRVLTPAGAHAPRQVTLQRQDFVDLTTFTYTPVEPDGSFLFRHVHPGSYTLRYLAASNSPKAGELWAEQAIQVGSSDVRGVTLALQPATLQDVSGALVFQDSSKPAPLSVLLIGTYPGTLPKAVGVNFTETLQFAPAATLVPQVLVCAKSPALVPVTAMLVMVRAPVPVLVRVTD